MSRLHSIIYSEKERKEFLFHEILRVLIMHYRKSKTMKKAALPGFILILVNLVIAYCKQSGIEIDEAAVWEIAFGGYGSLVALMNYLKNRKKGKGDGGKNAGSSKDPDPRPAPAGPGGINAVFSSISPYLAIEPAGDRFFGFGSIFNIMAIHKNIMGKMASG
jgi:hypothetical protein